MSDKAKPRSDPHFSVYGSERTIEGAFREARMAILEPITDGVEIYWDNPRDPSRPVPDVLGSALTIYELWEHQEKMDGI